MVMIKAITFDLDGVYFPNGKANFIKNLDSLGVSESEARRVFLQSDQMNKVYKNGLMTDKDFWAWAAKEWGFTGVWLELPDLMVSGYDVSPEVASIVRGVRENGYKSLICSNNFPARVNGLNNRFKFLEDFDAWVFSFDVGESKPSEKIFRELIKRSGVAPQEIVFADDHEENVTAARKLGITAFVYEGFDKFIDRLRSLGVNV
jgi:putative hydrolase of the HAD superfamily